LSSSYGSLFKAELDKLMQEYRPVLETLEHNPTIIEEYGDRTRRLGRLLEDKKILLDLGLVG
jgi:hypothetical protein